MGTTASANIAMLARLTRPSLIAAAVTTTTAAAVCCCDAGYCTGQLVASVCNGVRSTTQAGAPCVTPARAFCCSGRSSSSSQPYNEQRKQLQRCERHSRRTCRRGAGALSIITHKGTAAAGAADDDGEHQRWRIIVC